MRVIAAVIGSSAAALAAVYLVLLAVGEAGSPLGRYMLTNTSGFTLLGVLGFLVPLHFGLNIAKSHSALFYVLPGFLVAAGATLIMGLTTRAGASWLMIHVPGIGLIGAFAAFVFWVLAAFKKSG